VPRAKRTTGQTAAPAPGAVDDGHSALDGAGGKVISDAAIVAMSEQGYHGTSVRDIADRAGMSSASLYHHFSSKQDLLFRITDRGIEALVRKTEDALQASPEDPAARLRAIVRVHVLTHIEDQRGSFIGNSEIRSLEPANRAIIVSKRDHALSEGGHHGVDHHVHGRGPVVPVRRPTPARRHRRALRRPGAGHARLPASALTARATAPLGLS